MVSNIQFKQLKQQYINIQMQTALASLKTNGYGVIPRFISPETCDKAIEEINRLILGFQPTSQQISIFTTGEGSNKNRSQDYFLNSADKVRFFYQQKAMIDGKLVVPKLHSINKIGHSLHEKNHIFQEITYRSQVRQISNNFNIKNPVVVQSMAILKPPKIGGEVCIHQDSTFLLDQPETLLGFWIPLQDATLQNGCLWGLPGSHKGKLFKLSKMNWSSKSSQQQILHEVDYKDSDFVPFQMQRGSLAFFTGRFLHKSEANTSNKPRYAYTWHLKDRDTKWEKFNWLQRQKFPDLKFNYI